MACHADVRTWHECSPEHFAPFKEEASKLQFLCVGQNCKPRQRVALAAADCRRQTPHAAATGATVRWPDFAVEETGGPVEEKLRVEVREPELCTRFVCRWVSGAKIGPSPDWVQMRLQAAGMRPVSNVVDAANFVMLELGKPTHTFNGAAVKGGTIIVRRALAGERLETLDHVERELTTDTLIIADRDGPIGIAGVMGGADSEITDDTTEIAIESAIFDAVSIRRTGHRYALRSEASLRFEKGQETRLARIGAVPVGAIGWEQLRSCSPGRRRRWEGRSGGMASHRHPGEH